MSWRIGISALVLAAVAAAPGLGADPDPDASLLTRLNKELLGVQHLIQNAQVKLEKKNVAGMGRAASKSKGPDTPAKRCCAGNLKRMAERYKASHGLLAELGQCYEAKNDRPSMHSLSTVKRDLELMEKGTGAFAGAASEGQSKQALAGMTRAYLALRESVEFLPECIPADPVPGTNPPG